MTAPADARALARGVIAWGAAQGWVGLTETPLADGRRADVMLLGPDGAVGIVEVKSGLADLRADKKWPGYRDWCDLFWFAVAESFPIAALPDDAGVLIADAWEAHEARPPPAHRLTAARRKAVTLRFARLAAERLRRMGEGGPASPPLASPRPLE